MHVIIYLSYYYLLLKNVKIDQFDICGVGLLILFISSLVENGVHVEFKRRIEQLFVLNNIIKDTFKLNKYYIYNITIITRD